MYSTSSHGKLQCDALKEIDHMYKNGINQTGTIFAVKALHGFTGLQESHFHATQSYQLAINTHYI